VRGGIVRLWARGICESEDGGADGIGAGGRGKAETIDSDKEDDKADEQPDGETVKK